jgi:hypothetical protein
VRHERQPEAQSPSPVASARGGWLVPRDTLICRHGETATLLSTHAWRYFGLNASATWMWLALANGGDLETTAAVVARAYDVPSARVRPDVEQLVATLTRLGFLRAPGPAAEIRTRPAWSRPSRGPSRATSPTPSLLTCTRALLWAGWHLRHSTLDAVSWLDQAPPDDQASPLTEDTRLRITRQLRRAAAWLPARTYCLQESLALVALLRGQGIDASLRLGARPYPFVAHAWVEADHQPVNERDEHLAMYAPFRPAAGAC